MGTKNNPGKFDCHAAAEDNEPLFTLLARDPLAPDLLLAWAEIRRGHANNAYHVLMTLLERQGHRYVEAPEHDKADEATQCAKAMIHWRRDNRPDPDIYATIAEQVKDHPGAVSGRMVGKPRELGMPYGKAEACRCGLAACPQCDTIALEPGFIHEGP